MATERLLDLPPAELLARARAVRDAATGTRVTYSPKVFIPLTMLCRDRCGYCTFAQPPARLTKPYLDPDDVLAIARAGARAGCHEALFTLGERPEERYSAAGDWLAEHGYESTVHYLAEMCRLVLDETGLLPHANAGALHEDELARLRPVAASQGMMLESLRPDLDAHRGSPDKTPERRLATLETAGRLDIPFTTGILVGIGESRADRLEALTAVAESHRRWGHVQEVIVQNFLPKPGTAMHQAPPCPPHDHLEAIALTGERSTAWYSGANATPPTIVSGVAGPANSAAAGAHRGVRGRVVEILTGVEAGQVPGEDELVDLFAARGPEVVAVAELADELRRQAVGDVVTYVRNRNINYTNVCTFKCRFCGFSKGPLSLNLRGTPYLLTLDDIAERVREAWDLGATEVCLQGGIHPSFDGDYYIDVARAVKAAAPDIHVHG